MDKCIYFIIILSVVSNVAASSFHHALTKGTRPTSKANVLIEKGKSISGIALCRNRTNSTFFNEVQSRENNHKSAAVETLAAKDLSKKRMPIHIFPTWLLRAVNCLMQLFYQIIKALHLRPPDSLLSIADRIYHGTKAQFRELSKFVRSATKYYLRGMEIQHFEGNWALIKWLKSEWDREDSSEEANSEGEEQNDRQPPASQVR
jgi:hypothetical protein